MNKLFTHQKDSPFDFTAFEHPAIEQLQSGESLNEVFKPLIKSILEKSLEVEIDLHLDHPKNNPSKDGNHCNGRTKKHLKTSHGTIELETPRDRNSTFDPQMVKKRQTTLGDP